MRLSPTGWITTETIFGQLFWVLVFAVQAPVLGPRAFGLVAIIMVFIGLWESIPGVAATDALISVRDIDELHFSTVTTAGVIASLVLGAIAAAFAQPLARLVGDVELVGLMRAMAVLPLLHALSIAPTAAAQRNLRFQSTALRTIVSLLAGGAVGLTLSFTGAGAWALVWQAIVQRFVAAIVLWFAVPLSFRFAISRRHLRELVGFAWPVMVARAMTWASGQVPRLIIGLFLGPTELGLFSIATRLSDIVAQVAIAPRSLVARVDLRQFAGNPDALGKAVRRISLKISVMAFPLCIGGAVVMPNLFRTWLDPRWSGAIEPSQLMLLTGLPLVTFYVVTAVLLALNLQRWEAHIAVAQSVGVVIAVTLATPFGLEAIAAAIGAVLLVTVPLAIIIVQQKGHVRLRTILLPQAPALAAAGSMGIALLLLRPSLEAAFASVTTLSVMIGAGGTLYVLLLAIMTPEPLNVVRHLVNIIVDKIIVSLRIRRFLRPVGIEWVLYYYRRRLFVRPTAQCRQQADIVQLLSKIDHMQLTFSVTAGRSGTFFVHKLLSRLPNVTSEHEATPTFHAWLRKAQRDPAFAMDFLLNYKLPSIARHGKPNYVELSHVFCKGYLEPLLQLGITPNLILLRKAPRLIALSYLQRYTIPERTFYGIEFLLSPRYARAISLPLWRRLTDYQLVFWYALEIERRQLEYSRIVRDRRGIVCDVTAEELRDFDRFFELVRTLGLVKVTADRCALAREHAVIAGVDWNKNVDPLWEDRIDFLREEEEVWQLVSASAPHLRPWVEQRYQIV